MGKGGGMDFFYVISFFNGVLNDGMHDGAEQEQGTGVGTGTGTPLNLIDIQHVLIWRMLLARAEASHATNDDIIKPLAN